MILSPLEKSLYGAPMMQLTNRYRIYSDLALLGAGVAIIFYLMVSPIIKTIEEGGIHQTSNLARNYILRTKCVVFDAITGADQFDENPEDLYCLHQILGFDISPDDLDSLDIQ